MSERSDKTIDDLVEWAERHEIPPESTRCPHCNAPLLVAWRNGRPDSVEPPLFFCGPCFQRTGEA